MKKLFRLLTLAVAATTAFAFASCSKDNDGPKNGGTDPTPIVNTAQFGDTKLLFNSVVIDDTAAPGMVMIGATPDAGVETIDELLRNENDVFAHSYFIVIVDASAIADSNLDVKTTKVTFSVTNTLGIAKGLKQIFNDGTDEVSAGTIAVKTVDGKLTLDASFKLTAGGELTVNCQGNIPPSVPDLVNKLTVGDTEIGIKSMFIDDEIQSGYAIIGISAEEGLDTYEKMTEFNDAGEDFKYPFMMIMVATATLADSQLDLLTTETLFSVMNVGGYALSVPSLDNMTTEGISAGTLSFSNKNDKQGVGMSLTLDSGESVELQLGFDYKIPEIPTSNFLSLDGEIKAVKTAYYEPRQNGTALYLTPARINSVLSLSEVNSYYVMLYADNMIANGNDVDITKTSSSAPFEFRFVNPSTEENISISTGNLQGATGTFSLADRGDGRYAVKFDITIGGHQVTGDYDDAFERYQASIYLLNDDPMVVLQSAVVSKGAEVTTIYLSAAANVTTVAQMQQNKPIILTIRTTDLNNGLLPFSSSDVSITIDGQKYSHASDSLGNIDAALSGSQLEVKFNMYDYGKGDPRIKGQYVGNCVVL